MPVEGLDVYSGTGGVEWHRVAAAGKGFAFIRGAYGVAPDKMVRQNFAAAKGEGLVCGVYHFFRAPLDVTAQVQAFCQVLDDIKLGPGDLPPVIDVEDNPNYDGPWNRADNAEYLAHLGQWLTTLEQRTHRPPIIYVSSGFWSVLGNPTGFKKYRLWVANYGVQQPRLPSEWNAYDFWQYTDSGTVDGIPGSCDLDVFNGSLDDLRKVTLS